MITTVVLFLLGFDLRREGAALPVFIHVDWYHQDPVLLICILDQCLRLIHHLILIMLLYIDSDSDLVTIALLVYSGIVILSCKIFVKTDKDIDTNEKLLRMFLRVDGF